MIDVTADRLRMEIEAAIRLRRKHTDISRELIERFAGHSYREDWEPDGPSHENHEFERIANIILDLLHDNPKVSVKSRRPVVQRELIEAMEHGLSRLVHDINLRTRIEPIAEDKMAVPIERGPNR